MPKETRYIPEQIIGKLREAEVEISKGRTAAAMIDIDLAAVHSAQINGVLPPQ